MVHLFDTAPNLTTVMGSIWLPIEACRTPYGTTISFAGKYILSIELSEIRRWICSGQGSGLAGSFRVKATMQVIRPVSSSFSPGKAVDFLFKLLRTYHVLLPA